MNNVASKTLFNLVFINIETSIVHQTIQSYFETSDLGTNEWANQIKCYNVEIITYNFLSWKQQVP